MCPASVRVSGCAAEGVEVALGAASARDACSTPTVTSDAPARYEAGVTQVRFAAVDAADNRAECLTTVEVADDTPPVVTCTHLVVKDVTPPTVYCGAPTLVVELPTVFQPTAEDACGVELVIDDVQCVRVVGDAETPVPERCEARNDQNAVVLVEDAPPLEGGEMRIAYTVRATDPSGNETVVECEASVDPEAGDRDQDDVADRTDNCVDVPNEDQLDSDLDGLGAA